MFIPRGREAVYIDNENIWNVLKGSLCTSACQRTVGLVYRHIPDLNWLRIDKNRGGGQGGGGTGIRGAELGVEGAESGMEGRNRGWRGREAGVDWGGKLISLIVQRTQYSALKWWLLFYVRPSIAISFIPC